MKTRECTAMHIVACDLDDSLVTTQSYSEQARQESDTALHQIGAFITNLRTQKEQIYFGSATGRTFASVQALANERPAFAAIYQAMDFHITSVGTAIYLPDSNARGFSRAESWPPVTTWNREALTERLAINADLALQPVASQDTYKISYMTTSHLDNIAHAAQLDAQLAPAELEADILVSGSGAWRFVDVLPRGVNKGSALVQLPSLLHGKITPETPLCRVVAGDSMNDKAALAVADVAIIPSNAQPDLVQWAERQPTQSFYFAEERFGMGVLQGLQAHLQRS